MLCGGKRKEKALYTDHHAGRTGHKNHRKSGTTQYFVCNGKAMFRNLASQANKCSQERKICLPST